MDACVPAFIADDQASDTKGFGLATAVWTRFWTRTPPTPIHLYQGRGHGGIPARVSLRKDFTKLCQNPTGPRMTPQGPSEEP